MVVTDMAIAEDDERVGQAFNSLTDNSLSVKAENSTSNSCDIAKEQVRLSSATVPLKR